MKGYFSQLARHTGLSFGNQPKGAGRVSSEPAVKAGPRASAAPIEVNEVVFTGASPAVAPEVSSNTISGAGKITDGATQAASSVTPNEVIPRDTTNAVADTNQNTSLMQTETGDLHDTVVIPDASFSHVAAPDESRVRFITSEPAEPLPEQVVFNERPFDQSLSRPLTDAEPQRLTDTETVQTHTMEFGQQSGQPRDVAVDVQEVEIVDPVEPSPTNEEKPLQNDRRQLFQNHLKEVIAWITSPPEEVDHPLQAFDAPEVQQTTSNVFIREQERSSRQAITPREPQVQDLSLSIGTISIVVEEPKQDHPVSLTPPPSTQTSPQPVAPEPTRLSRYYLRNL
jgi:hypothetical protein